MHKNYYVSATELAALAKCEKQIQLQQLLGQRYTTKQKQLIEKGNQIHHAFYQSQSAKRGFSFRKLIRQFFKFILWFI